MSQTIEIKPVSTGQFGVRVSGKVVPAVIGELAYILLESHELADFVNRANQELVRLAGGCGRSFESALPGCARDICKIKKEYASVHGCPDCRGCGHG